MIPETSHRALAAIALGILCWIITYILFGFFLVDRGFIAFVWPAYEIAVSIFNAEPSGPAVRISIAVFVGLIWAPLPPGIIKRKFGLIAIPFGVLFGNWLSGVMWGHAYSGI